MNPRGDKFYLEAASLSAPSHWSLTDKFSKNLMNIHEGAPSYKEKIGNRVNQIFNKLPTDKILERLNWSLFDSPNLFQPVRNTTHVKIKKKINIKFILIIHNNPISLGGSKSAEERRFLIENCEKIIFVSNWVKEKFFEGLNIQSHTKCIVVYPGIDEIKKQQNKQKKISFEGK